MELSLSVVGSVRLPLADVQQRSCSEQWAEQLGDEGAALSSSIVQWRQCRFAYPHQLTTHHATQRSANDNVWHHDKFAGGARTVAVRKAVIPLVKGDLRSTLKAAKQVKTLKESQQEDLRASINASRVQQRIGKPAAPPADPILVVNNLAESVSARDIQVRP